MPDRRSAVVGRPARSVLHWMNRKLAALTGTANPCPRSAAAR